MKDPPDTLRGPPLKVPAGFQPLAVALVLCIVYMVLFGAFIFTSGLLAFEQADSLEHLRQIELVRGIVFVLVTGLLFFYLALYLLQRIASQARQTIAQQQALLESDRHAMTGLFAASMAHDMGNLLMVAQSGLHTLKIHPALGEEGEQAAAELSAALADLGALVQRLMTVVRERTPGQLERVNLAEVVAEAVQVARAHQRVQGCDLRASLEDCTTFGNPVTLQRALLNLILNAAEATQGTGRIEVRLSVSGYQAALEVHDNGPGISDEARQRIFEAFFSTKAKGTGLGLLSVRACAEEHRGRVEVLRSPLGGACFRLSIPLTGTQRRSPAPAPGPLVGGR